MSNIDNARFLVMLFSGVLLLIVGGFKRSKWTTPLIAPTDPANPDEVPIEKKPAAGNMSAVYMSFFFGGLAVFYALVMQFTKVEFLSTSLIYGAMAFVIVCVKSFVAAMLLGDRRSGGAETTAVILLCISAMVNAFLVSWPFLPSMSK